MVMMDEQGKSRKQHLLSAFMMVEQGKSRKKHLLSALSHVSR